MKKNHWKFTLIFLFVIALCWFSYNKMFGSDNKILGSDNKTQKVQSSIIPGFGENSSSISYGLLDGHKKVIDNGELLIAKNNKLEYTISLSNFIKVDRKYALIILDNQIQVPFTVKGKRYDVYTFDTKANETVEIKTVVPINKNSSEIDYLLIKKPEYLLDKIDLQKMTVLQEILPLRFKIKNSNVPTKVPVFIPDKIFKNGANDNIFVSKKENELNVLPTIRSGEYIYISVGAIGKDKENYNIIAFENWKQIAIKDNYVVGKVKINPGERKVYKFKVPNVKKNSSFQVIAVPKFNETNRTDVKNTLVYGSIRTTIKP